MGANYDTGNFFFRESYPTRSDAWPVLIISTDSNSDDQMDITTALIPIQKTSKYFWGRLMVVSQIKLFCQQTSTLSSQLDIAAAHFGVTILV